MRHMADQDTAPLDALTPGAATEVEHSGADVFAGLVTTPKRVELVAAGYSLSAPVFATPVLTTPVTPLQVTGYSLGAPELDVPVLRTTHVRLVWEQDGRPPDIPNDKKPKLIAALAAQLTSLQMAAPWKTLTHKDPAVVECVRKLAQDAGVDTSDYTLRTQIVSPAFRIWRRPGK